MAYYWLGALSQRTYPGVRDIDDCWVVASIWAVRYQTHQISNLPSCPTFRAAAGNPDDPYRSDGGNAKQIHQAVDRLWPTVQSILYQSMDWDGFVRHLKAGASATVATLSSRLPSNLRFGFYGPHQIAVVYRMGAFYAMNPLQPNGSPLIKISESALKAAVKAVANGWVLAVIFPKIDLGTFKMGVRTFNRWKRTASGAWVKERRVTRGWSATACPPKTVTINGVKRRMCLISTGAHAGYHVNPDLSRTNFTP
jgi:hypothetical protein